ncbi:MAG: S1C family serine protease [Dehalococcoidia bacterium]
MPLVTPFVLPGVLRRRGVLTPIAGLLLATLLLAPACTDDGPGGTDGTATDGATSDAATTDAATTDGSSPGGAAGGGQRDGSDDGDASDVAGSLTSAVERVVEDARPSVVQITNQQALSQGGVPGATPGGASDTLVPAGVGSGVVIDDEGHILTNHHVIAGAASVVVRFTDGREFDAEVVGTDPRTDLAVLRIEGEDLPVAALGASGELVVGEWVVAIGNALGLVGGPTVTVGVVSAVGRTVQEPPTQGGQGAFLFDVIQTDAAINPGNSGGPLLNLEGEVIGINTLGAGNAGSVPVQGISFAIAIDTALPLAEEMIATGTVTHPYIGIFYVPLNPAVAGQMGAPVSEGVAVQEVASDSPAADAGIAPGDIIIEIDGDPIEGESDLPAALDRLDAGDEVELVVLRAGEEVSVTVVLGEAPAPDGTPSATP